MRRTSSPTATASHTPGPWQTSGEMYTDVFEIWSTREDGKRKGFLIADVHRDTGEEVPDLKDDPTRANARLIAAAPYLLTTLHNAVGSLEAIQEALEGVCGHISGTGDGCYPCEAFVSARKARIGILAAIEKAEGRES